MSHEPLSDVACEKEIPISCNAWLAFGFGFENCPGMDIVQHHGWNDPHALYRRNWDKPLDDQRTSPDIPVQMYSRPRHA